MQDGARVEAHIAMVTARCNWLKKKIKQALDQVCVCARMLVCMCVCEYECGAPVCTSMLLLVKRVAFLAIVNTV